MKKNMNNLTEFNPTKAEIQATVMEVQNLTIAGIEDVAGYEAVKVGKKRLADYRIKITKYGKEQREEALAWQREVLRQENELIAILSPTESALKAKMEAIDQEKKRAERAILLPSRKKMLEEVNVVVASDEILLDMNEAQFSIFFAEAKRQAMDEQERIKAEEERRKQFATELEEAKKKAAEKAIIDERERVEREKKDQEMMRQAEIENEKMQQKRLARNKKYKEWLDKNSYKPSDEFYILQDGNTFTLYKKIDSITI